MSDSGKVLGLCDECGSQYGHTSSCVLGIKWQIAELEAQLAEARRDAEERPTVAFAGTQIILEWKLPTLTVRLVVDEGKSYVYRKYKDSGEGFVDYVELAFLLEQVLDAAIAATKETQG